MKKKGKSNGTNLAREQDVSPLLHLLDLILSHFTSRFSHLHVSILCCNNLRRSNLLFVLDLFVFIGFAKKTGDVSELQIGVKVHFIIIIFSDYQMKDRCRSVANSFSYNSDVGSPSHHCRSSLLSIRFAR